MTLNPCARQFPLPRRRRIPAAAIPFAAGLAVMAVSLACNLSATGTQAQTGLPPVATIAVLSEIAPLTTAAQWTFTLTPSLEPTATATATWTLTPTLTPLTMTAGQSLSCVKGPQWILYEWVTSIAEGETVTLLARNSPGGDEYYYVRKTNGIECWAFGGSSTKSGPTGSLPIRETPPPPTVTYAVANQTHYPICDLLIRGKDETVWGADRLGAGTILPAAEFHLNITAGYYDVLIRDCYGGVLYQKEDTPIGSDPGYRNTVINLKKEFYLKNNTAWNVCRVTLNPLDGSGQFDIFSPSDGMISSGSQVNLKAVAGLYDIILDRCGDFFTVVLSPNKVIGPNTTGFTYP